MSSHEARVWDTPGEEHLASLMTSASKLIVPSSGYSLDLKLYGTTPDTPAFQELQAHFQTSLDLEKGSYFHFLLRDTAAHLTMDEFSAALPRDSGDIHLEKITPTELLPYEYIPSVNVLGRHNDAKQPAWDSQWQKSLQDRLSAGHNLDLQRPPDPNHFRVWLGHAVLSKCRGWHITEEQALSYSVSDRLGEKFSIVRKQNVPETSALTSQETVSLVSETTDLLDPTKRTVIQRLDMISEQNDIRFVRVSGNRNRVHEARPRVQSRGAKATEISFFTEVMQQLLSESQA